MLSDGFLAMMGIDPADYPDYDDLAEEIVAAIVDAANDAFNARAAEDPLLRALLNPRHVGFVWGPLSAGRVRPGMQIRWETTDWLGHPDRVYLTVTRVEPYEDYLTQKPHVRLSGHTFTGSAERELAADAEIDTALPLPVDYTTLTTPPEAHDPSAA